MPAKIEKEKKLNIIKVPLGRPQLDIKPNFKPNDMLYLEYLENKLKVKKELRNVNYVSKMTNHIIKPYKEGEDLNIKFEGEEDKKIWDITDKESRRREDDDRRNDDRDKRREDDRRDRAKLGDREDIYDRYYKNMREQDERERNRDREEREERRRRYSSKRTSSRRSSRRSSRKDNSKQNELDKILRDVKELDEDRDYKSKSEESHHQAELGGGTKLDDNEKNNDIFSKPSNILPSLTDIEKNEIKTENINGNNIRDISHITAQEEMESNKRRELMFRFEILKKSYQGMQMPDYSEYTELKTLQNLYDDTVRKVALDSTVESYKQYMYWGFIVTEMILGGWMGLDIKGFANAQMLNMNKYERLLIELGEKNYLSGPSSWPVEVRLLGTILLQAAIFVGSKVIAGRIGIGVNANPQPVEKPKMKGPNLSDLNLNNDKKKN